MVSGLRWTFIGHCGTTAARLCGWTHTGCLLQAAGSVADHLARWLIVFIFVVARLVADGVVRHIVHVLLVLPTGIVSH